MLLQSNQAARLLWLAGTWSSRVWVRWLRVRAAVAAQVLRHLRKQHGPIVCSTASPVPASGIGLAHRCQQHQHQQQCRHSTGRLHCKEVTPAAASACCPHRSAAELQFTALPSLALSNQLHQRVQQSRQRCSHCSSSRSSCSACCGRFLGALKAPCAAGCHMQLQQQQMKQNKPQHRLQSQIMLGLKQKLLSCSEIAAVWLQHMHNRVLPCMGCSSSLHRCREG